MISSFHIGNFKSYRDARLPLAPLTLLIGANASGKSNAIEAIRLLSMLADGRRLEDIRSDIQASDDVIRGNAVDLARDRESPILVGCEVEPAEWNELEIAIRMDSARSSVEDEFILGTGGKQLYAIEVDESSGKREMEVHLVDVHEAVIFFVPVSDQQAIFTQLGSPARFVPWSTSESLIPSVVTEFRENLERVLILDPQPRRMRGYSFSGERLLKEDGSNLSSVLLDICSDPGASQAVLGFVADLPEQPFVDIGFIRTERGDVMVRLTESYGDRLAVRDAPVLSDGTLRVLGIAAALFSAEAGSTIVIEEIDNGVHPSRAETLLRNIDRVAKERDLRVLLTTHNPALLDRLPTDAIPHVVCAYRDPDEGDSRLVRLEDLPSYPELIARGPLGQLMTRGVLDYFLKHQRSPEEKEEQSQRWLEALKAQVGDA